MNYKTLLIAFFIALLSLFLTNELSRVNIGSFQTPQSINKIPTSEPKNISVNYGMMYNPSNPIDPIVNKSQSLYGGNRLGSLTNSGWAYSFGGTGMDYFRSVSQTSNGGYIVSGYTDLLGSGKGDGWVVKLDAGGSIEWQKTYGGTEYDTISDIHQTKDGDFIAIGDTFSNGAGNDDIWVLKLYNDGSINWQKTYGGANYDWEVAIQQTADNGYILLGGTSSFAELSEENVLLIKLDTNGNVSWQKSYDISNHNLPLSIIQTTDGGYVIAGSSWPSSSVNEAWILKLDSNGNVVWLNRYPVSNYSGISSIQQTADGGFVTLGIVQPNGSTKFDVWVMKLSGAGSILWSKSYGETYNYEEAQAIQQTTDGGYVIVGDAEGFGAGKLDIWVFKIDAAGILVWQHMFGNGGNDHGLSIQQTTDNGFIVAGDIAPTGGGYGDGFVLKLDPKGTIIGCNIMGDSNVGTRNLSNISGNAIVNVITVQTSISSTTFQPITIASQRALVCMSLNLSISHLEITQVIQDMDNTVPLIANKPTFVRVYVDCGEGCSSIPDITGILEVTNSVGSATLQPDMGPIQVEHPQGWVSQRGSLKKTLNFYKIPSNLLSGTVTFTAYVGNTILSETRQFVAGKKLRIAWVPVRYQQVLGIPKIYSPDKTIPIQAQAYMRKVYPLAGSDLDYFQQPLQPSENDEITFFSTFTWNSALNEYLPKLNTLWDIISRFGGWHGGQPPDRLFGWVPSAALPYLHSSFGGMAYSHWPSYGWNGSGRVAVGLDRPWPDGAWGLAHEISHLLDDTGLIHADCNMPAGEFVEQQLPGGRIDDWGIDFISTAPELKSPIPNTPNTANDFMSYCVKRWASKYHYRRLEGGFQQYTPQNSLLESIMTNQTTTISVIGTVYTPTLNVEFGTFYPLSSIIPPDNNSGTDYCLELRNVSGSILDERCLDLNFVNPANGQTMDRETFSIALPYPEGTQSVVLTHQGLELGRVNRSNAAPTVNLTYPNGGELWSASGTYTVTWTANDNNGDPLHFIVSYSDNGGASWMPLALDITANHLAVDSPNLPGSTYALFKVTATDQMNSGEDISNASLFVGKKTPQATILLPEQNATISPSLPFFLQGYAYDLEEGTLSDSQLWWTSDHDGFLGSGSTLIVNLTNGSHVITLFASDSDGNTASTTIDLFVGYKIFLPTLTR